MSVCDKKVAIFPSQHTGGDVVLWYCETMKEYLLRYKVVRYNPDGMHEAMMIRSFSYTAGEYLLMGRVFAYAMNVASTPLSRRS